MIAMCTNVGQRWDIQQLKNNSRPVSMGDGRDVSNYKFATPVHLRTAIAAGNRYLITFP